MDRRNFVKKGVLSGTLASYSPNVFLPGLRRSKKYSTALIGAGWWGNNILREAVASGKSTVVGICDPDQRQIDKTVKGFSTLTPDKPRQYHDYRELLAKEKPEIVIVATPDHWHALCCIAAIESGAHVYVEKPVSHTIKEGRAMVNSARKHGKTVQVGTHRRMSPHNISGMEFLKAGKAGKIGMARAFVNYPGGLGKMTPDEEVPKELDWDMYCGPSSLVTYNRTMHPGGFRMFSEFSNGVLGDWGIHWLDQVLWWSEEKYPKKIYSTGGRDIKQENGDNPDHQVALYDFDGFTLEWEHRLFGGNNAEKTLPDQPVGVYFYGTEGTFHMGWLDGWTFYPTDKKKAVIHQDAGLHKPDDQNIKELWADFLCAVDNGKPPVCDIEIGQRSTNAALLGMLSYKLGRSIEWDGEREIIPNDDEANKLLSREYRGPWEYPKT